MGWYSGPCEECGEHLERDVRPGRKKLHIDCAVARMADQQRRWADKEGEDYRQLIRWGQRWSEDFYAERGDWYQKWLEGMGRYLTQRFPTEALKAATVPDETTPDRQKRTRRPPENGRNQR